MNCNSVQNNLSAYLDRELDGADMLAIRGHLMDCRACRAEEDSLRALKRLLSATSVPEPSADLADRLCAAVLSQHRTRISDRAPRVNPMWGGALTVAGVAALSVALSYTLYNRAAAPLDDRSAPRSGASAQDLTFDIQRDQVYAVGLDTTGGVPVLFGAGVGGR